MLFETLVVISILLITFFVGARYGAYKYTQAVNEMIEEYQNSPCQNLRKIYEGLIERRANLLSSSEELSDSQSVHYEMLQEEIEALEVALHALRNIMRIHRGQLPKVKHSVKNKPL